MPITHGIFSDRQDMDERFIKDYERLGQLAEQLKGMNLKIVLTSGSYDLFHEGHVDFLYSASELGDILIVGLDSDEKVKKRKGPNRPLVPEISRAKILCNQRGVTIVTLKSAKDPRWELIRTIKPDILVVSEDTSLNADDVDELLEKYCGEIIVFPRMGEDTTTGRIRRVILNYSQVLTKTLTDAFAEFLQTVVERMSHEF